MHSFSESRCGPGWTKNEIILYEFEKLSSKLLNTCCLFCAVNIAAKPSDVYI